jgi:thiamine biosynthesis lipoprotein
MNRPSYKDIHLDKKNLTITLAPKQRLDMGSIGKGYAIDLAYEVLSEFPGYIINAGGDIRAKGENLLGKPWSIALYKAQLPNKIPDRHNILGKISLRNQSIAGSGGWARRVGFFHHLINPRSGLPENNSSQSYVLADEAISADAWATTVFILGQPGIELAKRMGLEALLIDSQGQIFKTDGFLYH